MTNITEIIPDNLPQWAEEEIQAFNRWCASVVYPDFSCELQNGRAYLIECDHNGTQGHSCPDFYADANFRNKVLDVFRPRSDGDSGGDGTIMYYRFKETGSDYIDYIIIEGKGLTTDEAQIAYLTEEMKNDS